MSIMPSLRPVILAAVVALFAGTANGQVSQTLPRDRPPLLPSGTGAIRGRVVDGQTGIALDRARVHLVGDGLQWPSVLTDASGTFAFTQLPRGTFWLEAGKATYFSAHHPEPGQTVWTASRSLTLNDGEVIDGITMSMFHGGAITGRVVDVHGDPIESAQVLPLELPKSGRGRPQARTGTSTNDLGEFRLAHLQPGKYLVYVMPLRREMLSFSGESEPAEPQQPVPTFYPGVVAIDQAQPIAIERGTSAPGVEIMVVDRVMAQVSGKLVDVSGQPLARNGMVSAWPIVKDAAGGFGTSGSSVFPDGTFQLKLAPGEYELEGRAMVNGTNGPPAPGSEQYGIVRLTVSDDITGLTIPVGPGARVTGRLVFDGTAPAPPLSANGNGGIIFMATDGSGCRTGRSDIAVDGTFTVEGIFGTCFARFNGGFLPLWSVKTITQNGRDLMDQPITFTQGQRIRDVEVHFTDKPTELTLNVADEHGAPTREFIVLMFSTDKARWTRGSRYFRLYMPQPERPLAQGMNTPPGKVSTTTGGPSIRRDTVTPSVDPRSGPSIRAPDPTSRKDTVSGMPEADYYVVALDDIDGELARDPGLLQQLVRSATHVSLAAGVPAEVSVRRLKLRDVAQEH